MLKKIIIAIIQWKPISHFLDDLSSLRALWNWIMLTFFCWACTYVLMNNPEAHGTVITVLGGVATIIFTNYVASGVVERWNQSRKLPESEQPSEEEQSGSD